LTSLLSHTIGRAFVLHTRPYRNTSLLIDFFSCERGRIRLIAKGARTQQSPLKIGSHLFQPLWITSYGRGDLLSLKQAEIAAPLKTVEGSRLAYAFYLNELLYHLLEEHEPYPHLFERYTHLIQELSAGALSEAHLRLFERDLLDALGYGLPLTQVFKENTLIDPAAHYVFHQGFLPVPAPDIETPLVFRGKSLLDLHQGNLSDEVSLKESKRLLRYSLQDLLKEKKIMSRALLAL
jgi:DNA repair protein RecO (recombination protein O)